LHKPVDLHIIPRVEDEKSCIKTAQMLKSAGYRAVALTLPTGLLKEHVRSLRNRFADSGIEMFARIDISCANRQELLRLLRRFRNVYDVVAVKCVNHALGLVAARDRRVDIIFFDPLKRNVWFDHSIANVSRAALELNLSTLFSESILLTKPMKEIDIATQHMVRVVLSSGCTSPMMIRTPEQLSAIGMILGLNERQARDGVSAIPWSIVEQNVERRSKEYVEEGVRVVKKRAS
jgi:RNase P/RNase MRP subunit p30